MEQSKLGKTSAMAATTSKMPLAGRARAVDHVTTGNADVMKGLFLLFMGTVGLFLLFNLVVAFFRSLPLTLVVLYFAKPKMESFVDYLFQAAKKGGANVAADLPATGSSNVNRRRSSGSATPPPSTGGGWLMNLVSKTIEKTSAAFFLNPVREWIYIDLGILVLCKKKPNRTLDGLSAALSRGSSSTNPETKVFVLGIFFQWLSLDPTCVVDMNKEWPYWQYVYKMCCMVSYVWPDEKWHAFTSLAAQKRKERRRSAAVDAAVANAVSSVDEAIQDVVTAVATNLNAGNNSPPIAESGVAEGKPIRRHMQIAQDLAERGRFEEAGKAVEFGLEKCRNVLRGGIEEETELLLVASAFYEAGAPSSHRCSVNRIRCLEEAAEMCVVQKRWGKASELFEECVLAWLEDKKQDSLPCVLEAVFSQFMVGDTVKAEQFYKMVCAQDPKFKQTPEAQLIADILRGIRHHDPNLINEAKRAYKPKHTTRKDSKTLEHWQEQVIRHMMKRADATVLL